MATQRRRDFARKMAALAGAVTAAIVASIAVYAAIQNTTRAIGHADDLENRRRRRKHAAVRAVLPLALAQVTAYAERAARALNDLAGQCEGEALPRATVPENFVQPLPSETLKTLAEFIEYSDMVDVAIVEELAAWIQIFDSRLHDLVERNRHSLLLLTRIELMARIINAACIYRAAAAVAYARRRDERLPPTITWDEVGQTLAFNWHIWNDDYQRLIILRATQQARPFEEG